MEILYIPFQIFIIFPPLAFLVALIFLILLFNLRKRLKSLNYLLLITIICWVVYGLWEIKMFYWSKTVIAPIRVDLIFIVPFLYLISVSGFISYYRSSKKLRTSFDEQ